MLKSEIYQKYETVTRQTYKNQPLYIGDVYQNNLGTKSIVLEENGNLILVRENSCKFELPSQKSAFKDSEFVANVVQDIDLMNFWIEKGVIIEEEKAEVKKEEKPMAEETKEIVETPITTPITTLDGEINKEVVIGVEKEVKTKKSTKKEVVKEPKMNIYQKINAIRKAWSETDVEKDGKGRAGGGAKYDYYKPQQIIDFCLNQELKHNLYSKFSVVDDRCFYQLINLDNVEETETVACPFAIPKKMAASEAQQVGAAMTYHNRRLAMMMYKIEDNSKESIDVLENADYSKSEKDAPNIPAPPIEPKVPTSPVEPPKVTEVQKPIDAPKPPANQNVTTENEQKDDLPPWQANVKPIQVVPPTVPTIPPAVPPTTPATQSVPSTPTNSIESLY